MLRSPKVTPQASGPVKPFGVPGGGRRPAQGSTRPAMTGRPRLAPSSSRSPKEAMARWIDEHIAEPTRTFISRSEAGVTAGR